MRDRPRYLGQRGTQKADAFRPPPASQLFLNNTTIVTSIRHGQHHAVIGPVEKEPMEDS
jgi:hypothetical protein